MANDNDVIFEVNAGLILAKLHLGCKLMFNKIAFYNSGITGNDKGTPENPGDCLFDLKNMKGQYQIACSLEKFYYIRKITSEEINKLKSKMIAKDGKPEEDKLKKEKEELEKKLDLLTDDKDKADILKDQEKFLEDMKKLGFLYLKDYLENFCGKENASKLKETDIINTYVDEPFSYKYDDYKIPEAKNLKQLKKIEEDLAKLTLDKTIDNMTNIEDVKTFLSDKKELEKALRIDVDAAKVHIAFVTGYTVEVETM